MVSALQGRRRQMFSRYRGVIDSHLLPNPSGLEHLGVAAANISLPRVVAKRSAAVKFLKFCH